MFSFGSRFACLLLAEPATSAPTGPVAVRWPAGGHVVRGESELALGGRLRATLTRTPVAACLQLERVSSFRARESLLQNSGF